VTSPPEGDAPIPIGVAIANTEVFALTDDGTEAAEDEVGELYVRGSGVMHGYWGDPERTQQALVAHPMASGARDPAYRTGDLVSRDREGRFHLLGRRDHQIKSRGYRIELGEIETALYAHPDVLECAITAVPDDLISNRIQAHVVARPGLDGAELQRFCATRVPRYMVPESIESPRVPAYRYRYFFFYLYVLPTSGPAKDDRRVLSSN
jgi:acyl-coenzyme A synthetase/AMP-(fatty) acid ligase